MTTAALFHWLVMHDIRLSARGERLLVDSPKGVLADHLVTELREHKAGLLAIIRGGDDNVDVDRTTGNGPGSGVLSTAMQDSAAIVAELPAWADPTNPDVQAARSEAERLGVFDVRFPIDIGPDVSFNLADESTAEDRMWAELATMPATVLRDRARRTDHLETKRRLLALARREPAAIQAAVIPFSQNPTSAEANGRWVEGADLDRLDEQLQRLVSRRDGWTSTRWAEHLRHRARLCDDQHGDVAELYELAARILHGAGDGGAGK